MIPLDQALAAYAATLQPLPVIHCAPAAALGRVLAAPPRAGTDLPRFDQSAMDGYAFRAADSAAATAARPVRLRVCMTIAAAAQSVLPPLPPGAAARIFTGGMLPPGADAVAAQEGVRRDGDELRLETAWPVGRNVRARGTELTAGTALAAAGTRIGPGLLASLINGDVREVAVHRAPRVAVLTTGDELRDAGTGLAPGEIHDSNGPLCQAVLGRWHCETGRVARVGDDPAAVRNVLAELLDDHDLVLSCGGASVGDKDYLPATAEALGLRRVFWKVAQKPAKPLFFGVGTRGARPVALLALPGNPGAVLTSLLLHVRSALDVLEGTAIVGPVWAVGRLGANVERDRQRIRLVRMRLSHDDQGQAALTPLPHQESHMLSNLDRADVLVRIEAGEQTAAAGTLAAWIPMAL